MLNLILCRNKGLLVILAVSWPNRKRHLFVWRRCKRYQNAMSDTESPFFKSFSANKSLAIRGICSKLFYPNKLCLQLIYQMRGHAFENKTSVCGVPHKESIDKFLSSILTFYFGISWENFQWDQALTISYTKQRMLKLQT